MAVTGVAKTAAQLQAFYTTRGLAGMSEQELADLFASMATSGSAITPSTATFGGTYVLRNVDARKDGAWKTVVDAAAGSSLLGQAATTAGVNFVGNAASGNAKSDYAQIDFVLPATYVAGATITVGVRAKTTALSTVSDKVDVEVKVAADGTLGSDICTTNAQQMTTSFAWYSFTVTPTNRVAGDTLTIRFATLLDDTGGTIGGIGTIANLRVVLGS